MSDLDTEEQSIASLLSERSTPFTSVRSSFEYAVPDRRRCSVAILDESTAETGTRDSVATYVVPTGKTAELPNNLKASLADRDQQRTRWINIAGCSNILIDDLAQRYFDDHDCLNPHTVGDHSLGGPIKRSDGGHFVWIHNDIWYMGSQRHTSWSTVRQCGFRMVICLPTTQKAGTLITNFTGRQEIVEEVSRALTTHMLEQHAMGQEAMSCVWVLACSVMRTITAQLDLAFHNFDPLNRTHTIPDLIQLPSILEQANELARIDRYTSGLDEILEFFETVRTFQQSQVPQQHTPDVPARCYARISERSNLESQLARHKLRHAQQLCRTYIKQYESHVQTILSHSTTQIAQRLNSSGKVGEQVATVGIVLAAISGVTSPLAVVTGYFGMNVNELTEDGKSSLFGFWTVAVPVIALSVASLVLIFSRFAMSRGSSMMRRSSLHST